MLPALFAIVLLAAQSTEKAKGRFEYDPADETVAATMIGDEHCYDPQVVVGDNRWWVTGLEFEPGKGDRIWIGTRDEKSVDWISRTFVTPEPGIYKNPTLTRDSSGVLWLSVERQQDEQWSIVVAQLDEKGTLANAHGANRGVSSSPTLDFHVVGPGINHHTAPAREGGIWIVWQANREGRFQIELCRMTLPGAVDQQVVPGQPAANNWQPDIAALPDGDLYVTWDGVRDATNGFDTYLARRSEGRWSKPTLTGATEAFEARTRIVCDAAGHVWTTWEEGNRNWGGAYRYRMNREAPGRFEMSDAHGPLHAFRWVHVASVVGPSPVALDPALAMPAFDKLVHRPGAPQGVEHLGGYYERGELAVDGLDRLWIVYRHYYLPWLGLDRTTHVQQDWGLYARCFEGNKWSKLFRLDIGQGDGMQRLSVAPLPDGIAMTYATGRTDRRHASPTRGVAMAAIHLPGQRLEMEIVGTPAPPATCDAYAATQPADAPAEQVFFGDLHRHTDLSLCNVPTDGTMDDAYRYAIDAAHLDFLGITDHSRDIAEGDAKSLLYWRCRKEVSRHDLTPRFIPMYAYEHSRGGEDHNVISLRPNLWPDSMPFPELWKRMDNDMFTIPHQTICSPIPPGGEMPLGLDVKTWTYGDDAHRRLMEIYQGCRDRAIEPDAHAAFSKGHIMGFIASSDHLATSAGYAGVWAKDRTRESVFRALQARRTFGATDRISVKAMMGNHWMGEQAAAAGESLHLEAQGTAAIETVELIVDGHVQQTLPQGKQAVNIEIKLPAFTDGVHYFYTRLRQADGNQAWSSPIWIPGGGR